MSLILNQSQAEAVYSAMCHLNNVGMRIGATLDGAVRVIELPAGTVHVRRYIGGEWVDGELYGNQTAFATAYGLDTGADRLEQLQALGFKDEADYQDHQRVMSGMKALGASQKVVPL